MIELRLDYHPPVCAAAISAFSMTAAALRKLQSPKRFDRQRAMKPLKEEIGGYWSDGLDALFSFLAKHEGWEKIQRHVQLELAADAYGKSVTKALSDSDRQFFANLLTNFSYFDDVDQAAKDIIAGTSVDTFNDAANFALERLGIAEPDFELKNEAVREKLLERSQAAIFATRSHIDSAFETITNEFYGLGHNPYNSEFVDSLRETLGAKTDWQAKRFALTETGIASELAQHETYKRNGVQRKRWNVTGVNTREAHAELSGVSVGIDDTFDCGGSAAAHPLDPSLPADELVNCHCWLSPVVNDDFSIDPSRIWEGA